MTVLRKLTTSIELETKQFVDGVERIKKKTIEVTANTSQAAEQIEKIYGRTGKVVKSTSNEFDSQKAIIFKQRREINAAEKAMERFTREMQLAESSIGRTAQDQEILNAQMRLGAGATQAQKDQVANLIKSYDALLVSNGKTKNSFRSQRNSFSQIQFQLQDIGVQMQQGTSPFIILSQQGSQVASLFGPGGAVLGSLLAFSGLIGGVALQSMLNLESATKKLTKAQESLDSILSTSKDTGVELSDTFATVVERWKFLESAVRSTAINAQLEKNKLSVEALADGFDDIESKLVSTKVVLADLGNTVPDAFGSINISRKITDESIALKNAIADLNKEVNDDNIHQLAIAIQFYEGVTKTGSKETEAFKKKAIELLNELKTGKNTLDELTGGVDKLTSTNKASKTQIEETILKLKEQHDLYGFNADAIQLYTLAKQGANFAQLQEAALLLNNIKLQKEETEARKDANATLVEELKTSQSVIDKGRTRLNKLNDTIDALNGVSIAESSFLKVLKEENPVMAAAIVQAEQYIASRKKMDAETKASANAQNQLDQIRIQSQQTAANNLASIAEEGSGLAKAAFLFQQIVAAQEVLLNFEVAKSKANATMGVAAKPYVAALEAEKFVSLATIAATSVAGVFHDGGTIPTDGTYLLQGGEYVQSRAEKAKNDSIINNNNSNMPDVTVVLNISTVDQLDADKLILRSKKAVYSAVNQVMRSKGRKL